MIGSLAYHKLTWLVLALDHPDRGLEIPAARGSTPSSSQRPIMTMLSVVHSQNCRSQYNLLARRLKSTSALRRRLFDCDRFCKIARLIHIRPHNDGGMVS